MTGLGLRFLFQCARESALLATFSGRGWFARASFTAAFIACAISIFCTELDKDMPIFGNRYSHKQLDVVCCYTKDIAWIPAYGRTTSFFSLLGVVALTATFLFIRGIFQANIPLVWLLAVRQNPTIAIADQVWLNDGDIRLTTFSTCIEVPKTANETPAL